MRTRRVSTRQPTILLILLMEHWLRFTLDSFGSSKMPPYPEDFGFDSLCRWMKLRRRARLTWTGKMADFELDDK